MTSKKVFGYVYILTNPSFQEDWIKIGKSSRPVDIRSKELDNTSVPLPFEIYATLKSTKYHQIEKLVHKTIDRLSDLRIRQNREFFNIEPAVALDIFRDIASTIDDAEVVEYKDNKPILKLDEKKCLDDEINNQVDSKAYKVYKVDEGRSEIDSKVNEVEKNECDENSMKPRRKRFKFSMIGLKIGDVITFDPTGLEVKIASNDQVEYQGRLYKLSPFVGTFMPEEMRNTSGAYQGAKFFSYNGKVLDDLRKEFENKEK